MYQSDMISFRKLEETDLQTMYKWLNTDFVIEWYSKEGSSFEDIQEKYLPRIKGEQPIFSFMIVYDEKDVGYIQTYRIEDYPEYIRYVEIDERVAGVDLFIGEKDFIHKGLGKHILNKFLIEYVFVLTDTVSCIVGPEPQNKAAISAYKKAGFKYLKTIQVPGKDEPEYLMRLKKNELVMMSKF